MRIASDWCRQGSFDTGWRGIKLGELLFCGDFWRYFGLEAPPKNSEMRIVFSTEYVPEVDCKKTLFRAQWGREWSVSKSYAYGPNMRVMFHSPIDDLLSELFDRDNMADEDEVIGYWWPEYRDSVTRPTESDGK